MKTFSPCYVRWPLRIRHRPLPTQNGPKHTQICRIWTISFFVHTFCGSKSSLASFRRSSLTGYAKYNMASLSSFMPADKNLEHLIFYAPSDLRDWCSPIWTHYRSFGYESCRLDFKARFEATMSRPWHRSHTHRHFAECTIHSFRRLTLAFITGDKSHSKRHTYWPSFPPW